MSGSRGRVDIRRTYRRSASQEEFDVYPREIQRLFRDDVSSYVTYLRLNGIERFSKRKRKMVQEWYSGEVFGDKNFLVRPRDGRTFNSVDEALAMLIEEVKENVPMKGLTVRYDRDAPKEEFDKFSPFIKTFFRDRCYSHIKTVCVKGCMYYSKTRRKVVQEWHSVKAYAQSDSGVMIRVVYATPSGDKTDFGNFGIALKEFVDEAHRKGCRLLFDRDDKRTYEEDPDASRFFDDPRYNGIRIVKVFYSEDCNGYVVHLVNKKGDIVNPFERGRFGPFESAWDAASTFFLDLGHGDTR